MMEHLVTIVQDGCQHMMTVATAVSAIVPGTPLTQALLVGALVGFLVFRLMKKAYHLPPGPRPLPLLGNLLRMRSKEEQFYVTLDRWAKEKYGPVISIYMGPKLCIFLNDLDTITEAFVQKGTDLGGRPYLPSLNVLTEGYRDIAFSDLSPAWKLHRKIAVNTLRHYMTGSHLDKVVHEVMAQVADKMAAEPGSFDPHPYNSTLMFHVLNHICFGEAKSFDDPYIQHLVELFDKTNETMGKGFFEDVVPFLQYWPTKSFQSFNSMMSEFLDYVEKNIQTHREKFSLDNIQDVTDSVLLAQMEAAREESAEVMAMFTDVHVRQTIGDLFGAGVDTSRMTLDWAMLFMAGHPEIQKRAQVEIDAATGTEMPGKEHRGQLQYTRAVLQETLRMSAVAPMGVPHKALMDTTVGGYDVPKGTMMMPNLWAVTHDPRLWDEPDKFNPERFLDEQGKLKPTPKAWVPFSVGRRVCLGENVARHELLLILACFLKRFTISLPEGQTYDPSCVVGIMAHTPQPFKIVVTPR